MGTRESGSKLKPADCLGFHRRLFVPNNTVLAITGDFGNETKNLERVKKEFFEELHRIRSEPPTKAEVEDVKNYLLGQLPFEFTTNEQVAGRILSIERYHLGFNYLADFREAIAAVMPQD